MLTTSPTLLDRLRQPADQAAWERFATLYTPVLERWARKQGLREADAADLVQDVLLKLVRVLPTYERQTGRTFRAWLATVTANQCRDFREKRATRDLPGPDGLSGAGDRSVIEVEEREYRAVLVRQVMDVIRTDFDPKTWAAFAGVMVDRRPAAEVAAQLGMTANAVYLARHRVVTRLRAELADFLD